MILAWLVGRVISVVYNEMLIARLLSICHARRLIIMVIGDSVGVFDHRIFSTSLRA